MVFKENSAFLTVIGVFIGIVAASSLQYMLPWQDIFWILGSLGVLFLTIIFIYEMVIPEAGEEIHSNKKKNLPKIAEFLRISAVFIVGFFPFSLQKMITNLIAEQTTKTDTFWWSPGWFLIHLILITVVLISWNITKKKLQSEKIGKSWVAGIILILIFLFGYYLIKQTGII